MTVNSKSVVGIKWVDSGVVIGYQVDEITHIWLVECFIIQSHIYHGFLSKVSRLTTFHLNQGVRITPCWIEHGVDSILTDSFDTPKLDASFDEADAIFSLFRVSMLD